MFCSLTPCPVGEGAVDHRVRPWSQFSCPLGPSVWQRCVNVWTACYGLRRLTVVRETWWNLAVLWWPRPKRKQENKREVTQKTSRSGSCWSRVWTSDPLSPGITSLTFSPRLSRDPHLFVLHILTRQYLSSVSVYKHTHHSFVSFLPSACRCPPQPPRDSFGGCGNVLRLMGHLDVIKL